MREFADLARRALHESGYSIKAAARATNYDISYLSRVLNGKQKPSAKLAQSLDTLVGAGGKLVDIVLKPGDPMSQSLPPGRAAPGGDSQNTVVPPVLSLADFLPEGDPLSAAERRVGRRIGVTQVDDLRQRVHGLRLADDLLAGGDLIHPACRELRRAVKMYRESTFAAAIGRQLLCQVGELSQITGWIASDAGLHQEAERIYRLGISAARQAEDGVLAGNLAGSLAYQMVNTGREAEGLTLAQTALADAGAEAPPRARALYWDRVAWAHTKAAGSAHSQQAMRALGEAEEALSEDSAKSAGYETPAYLYWVNSGELRIMESRIYTELRRPLRAVPLLREVLSEYDATHAREMALYLSWLAVALADANEPEESAAVTERVIALSSEIASERVAERVRAILRTLRRYADVPEVAALLAEYSTA
ncbi:transcriptional regulator [Streptomyces sp. 71268]|uniref:helix-turn-helix domain-containing protein n=1 Tax=Streptomyces sp. 71268 TaxID=3002640 RepID=UPI0023F65272|nr:helix-turn-helix domain-containing protein [Streptomyces sp. 71268]WEV26395.1 transcriptional regulator [Streptomyces sp. 71268]